MAGHDHPWPAQRGIGILNNASYIGRQDWDQCSYVKDPRSGKTIARPNPPHLWEVGEVPHQRIVDDDLWAAVKKRQREMSFEIGRDDNGNTLNGTHRRRFLLSVLLKCASCGSGYTIVGKDRYGCSARRSKGTCDNNITIKRQDIEARVLEG